MKSYEHVKTKALEMRSEGKTISEICLFLSLPKGTVYYWIKDLPRKISGRTDLQRQALKKALTANKKKYKALRDASYEIGISEYDSLMKDNTFRDFVMLYLTEGFRKTKNQVAVTNSNPNLINLAFKWMKKLMNPDRKIDFMIQYHIDNKESELKDFWAKELRISPEQIKTIRKSNSGKLLGRKWRSVHGVFTIRTNDTYLRAKLEAWMNKLQDEWNRA